MFYNSKGQKYKKVQGHEGPCIPIKGLYCIIIGIAVSAVPKSHAHVLTLEKLTLLNTKPNQQIFLRITKTDQRIFLAIFLVVQP